MGQVCGVETMTSCSVDLRLAKLRRKQGSSPEFVVFGSLV